MKTYLVWNVGSALSARLCQVLALRNHRLLLSGTDPEQLAQLDEQLAQNELHRYGTHAGFAELAHWIREQHVGLDGVIAFVGANQSAVLRELFDALAALLERGKKPKRALAVLQEDAPAATNALPAEAALENDAAQPSSMRRAPDVLCREISDLAWDIASTGLSLNAALFKLGRVQAKAATEAAMTASTDLPGRPISIPEAARCCATLLDGLSPSLIGHTLHLVLQPETDPTPAQV